MQWVDPHSLWDSAAAPETFQEAHERYLHYEFIINTRLLVVMIEKYSHACT